MILLRPDRNDSSGAVSAIFGTGLLGFNIIEALRARSPHTRTELSLDWHIPTARPPQLRLIEDTIRGELQSGARLNVLWSAGHAGFMSSDDETAAELQSFIEVLTMTERLAQEYPRTTLHLISSAGGLFEGQRHVTPQSQPKALRPYGHMKLRQEQKLLGSTTELARRIYRVTSAYGYACPRFRAGLVATLILNAFRRQVTHLTGRMDTLRDYVFINDVASFVAERLVQNDEASDGSVVFLARARPCSLLEVQHLVEEAHGRKLYVSYATGTENAEDVTFSPATTPANWHPSDLRGNVGIIYRDAHSRGLPASGL
jgi:nucleoside-diphosphate-sugar epimerase